MLNKTTLAAGFALATGAAPAAFALDEIYSPTTEYRELSIEYSGNRTFDKNSGKNNAQENEVVFEAGVLPHLTLETSGIFEKGPGEAERFTANELEARWQFFEAGEYWLDSGLLVAYDRAAHREDADSTEIKLLLQKDTGMFTHTANIGFGQEVGRHAAGGPDFAFLWNSRYRYNQYFQPGIEMQSDLGQDAVLSRFNAQEHYIGPAVYGKLFGQMKYQAGYFFGVSDSASQRAARVLLEYEMHF